MFIDQVEQEKTFRTKIILIQELSKMLDVNKMLRLDYGDRIMMKNKLAEIARDLNKIRQWCKAGCSELVEDLSRDPYDELVEVCQFPRNTTIAEDNKSEKTFAGPWVAVPKEDFDALRDLLRQ